MAKSSKPFRIDNDWRRDNYFRGNGDTINAILFPKSTVQLNKMADDIESYMKLNHTDITKDRQQWYWNNVAKGYRSKYPAL